MAKPRIFISSTFYDLRYVREDIERFIVSQGYDAVRHETGSIPYAKKTPLEESAYREIAYCDIIVCVIGGRFGSDSATREGSITQNELQQALEKGIQVYVFVDQNVHTEYNTYLLNKDSKETRYRFVDNVKIFEFLEKIYALPQNNPITSFTNSADICTHLKAQWVGLFQRYLQEEQRLSEIRVVDEMKTVASTLQQLVQYLTEERKNKDDAIKTILLTNHPAFRAFANLTGANYRVFFTSKKELDAWLKARSYQRLKPDQLDSDSIMEWINKKEKKYIKLKENIFDNLGKLKPYSEEDWQETWVEISDLPPEDNDDDVPF